MCVCTESIADIVGTVTPREEHIYALSVNAMRVRFLPDECLDTVRLVGYVNVEVILVPSAVSIQWASRARAISNISSPWC
ncbi:hypothetical protein PILCRDRAFT_820052 [Piloderma croceum F 1598]|uniref:Uncharacterized protein n=1 Tax=Piloderma croceum (strain F 1598) TaxID=765440 RepID=A0A0C3BZG4_PILCF|nr:hypothetical protein PILCRDRAFT_820052 [Piloderma croceum F 1598]